MVATTGGPIVKIWKKESSLTPIIKNGGARGPTFADSGGASSSSSGKPTAPNPGPRSWSPQSLAAFAKGGK